MDGKVRGNCHGFDRSRHVGFGGRAGDQYTHNLVYPRNIEPAANAHAAGGRAAGQGGHAGLPRGRALRRLQRFVNKQI